MIRSKKSNVTKQNLVKLIQESSIRTFTILEPVEDDREVLELLRTNKGGFRTIIIGVVQ